MMCDTLLSPFLVEKRHLLRQININIKVNLPTISKILFFSSDNNPIYSILGYPSQFPFLCSHMKSQLISSPFYFCIIYMLQNQGEYHYLFKVVLVGNSCVGKSSIVVRYADDEFSEVFLATIGVDFRFKSFPLNSNKIKLQIWDTAGHQRFRTITSSYYRGAHALMIVFDITDKQSFEDATQYWYGEIRNSCPPETQILLVGNKCDMQNSRVVTLQEVQVFIQNHREIQYIQTSAKTSQHIEQAFHKIAGMLVDAYNKATASKDPKLRKGKKTTTTESTVEEGESTKLHKSEGKNYKYCCYSG